MRKVLEITFAGENFETRLAANTHEAFAQLAERPISVALVDVTLGDHSGYDVCKRLKSEYPAVRVLLLSSKQSPYDAARGVNSGADDHLDKPFDTQVLLDKVKALLSRAAVQPVAPAAPPSTSAPLSQQPAAALPVQVNDSTIPTAMPEAPSDDELLDDEGPLLIPIEDEDEPAHEPEPVTAAPPPPEPAAEPAVPLTRTVAIAHKPIEHTLPVAVSGNGPAALAPLETKLSALGLTHEQVTAVLALSREVIEAAVWEVVPTLAETLIKEEIRRLTQ